jgi:hypothetical protein
LTAVVGGVLRDDAITYGRCGKTTRQVRAYASANAPGGRWADAERLAAVIKAITGEEPEIRRMKDGRIMIECCREHLDGFMRYAELAESIKKWLRETRE